MAIQKHELRTLSRRPVAAEFLGISERQLDEWIRDGRIRATRLGRLVRIHRDELERIAREGVS